MSKLPRLNARQIIVVLKKAGFLLARQSGSLMIFKNPAGKRATVPYHASKDLHPRLIKSILREANLSVEDLEKLL